MTDYLQQGQFTPSNKSLKVYFLRSILIFTSAANPGREALLKSSSRFQTELLLPLRQDSNCWGEGG